MSEVQRHDRATAAKTPNVVPKERMQVVLATPAIVAIFPQNESYT